MQITDEDAVEFTDAERAEIAAEHDRIACRLWSEVQQAELAGKDRLAGRLRHEAWEATDIAEAARISSAALARIY